MFRRPLVRLLLAAAALMALSACASEEEGPDFLAVRINALSFEAQSGSAELNAKGKETEVTLDISMGQVAEQPAHIHAGTCSQPGAIVHGLNNVQTGRSITTVPATLASLQKAGYIIVVHKSVQEMAMYVACGTIPTRN